jgi:DNA polymerase-3 subunit alpha
MFDMLGDDAADAGFGEDVPPPDGQEWDRDEKLRFEKETLKMYVSDHPLSPYAESLKEVAEFSLGDLMASAEAAASEDAGDDGEGFGGLADGESALAQVSVPQGKQIKLAGMVTSVTPMFSKKNDRMAKFVMEDMEGNIDMIIFPQAFSECGSLIVEDAVLKVMGKFEVTDRGAQVLVNKVAELNLVAKQRKPKLQELVMPAAAFNQSLSDDLTRLLQRYPGMDPVIIILEQSNGSKLRAELPLTVDGNNARFSTELNALLAAN